MWRACLLAAAGAAIGLAAFAQARAPSTTEVEAQIADAANAFRADNRLGALTRNRLLTEEARRFAVYLASTGRFSHTADGREPGQRAQAAGYDYCELAENIAFEEDSAGIEGERLTRLLMAGWEASPGHRRNLLDPNVTETGVGVARAGSRHRYLAVQVFGRPISARYRFSIENRGEAAVGYTFDGEHRQLPPRSTMVHDTCATRELAFDRDIKPDRTGFRVTPGATYVVTPAHLGVRIEIQRETRRTGRADED